MGTDSKTEVRGQRSEPPAARGPREGIPSGVQDAGGLVSDLPTAHCSLTLKRCPRCEESLPPSEFGVCRARKDGLNLYCKRCIRQKIALQRHALREYKEKCERRNKANGKVTPPRVLSLRSIERGVRRLKPVDRVLEAVRLGMHTQRDIARMTKLPKDEVCEALANLLLWTREIRTEVNGSRKYFINDSNRPPTRRCIVRDTDELRSFGVSTIYQSGEPEIRGMSTNYLRNK